MAALLKRTAIDEAYFNAIYWTRLKMSWLLFS